VIYFGTGSMVAVGDLSITDAQYYYAIWDRGRALSPDDLATQTVTVVDEARVLDPTMDVAYAACSKTGGSSKAIFVSTTGPVAPASGAAPSAGSGAGECGWMIPLPSAGERVVTDTAFRGDGMIWFTSVVPTDTRTCGAGLTSWKWAVRMANGGSPTSAVFDYDGDGVVGSLGDYKPMLVDGVLTNVGVAAKQTTGGGAATASSFIGNRRFTCTTGGVGDCDDAVVPVGGEQQGRISWIQLQPAQQ